MSGERRVRTWIFQSFTWPSCGRNLEVYIAFTATIFCVANAQLRTAHSGMGLSRRLAQSNGADENILVPWYEDQSACATLNALDAAPLVWVDNAKLGYVLLRQGGATSSGEISMALDLTAHIADMYLAAVGTPGSSNLRVGIFTEPPTGCPSTSSSLHSVEVASDCSKRRASIHFPIPTALFNCSYMTPAPFQVTFYVQVAANLSFDSCAAPNGTFYAGSLRTAISPGCSYMIVRATCTPATCLAPMSFGGSSSDKQRKSTLLGVIIGVAVGTSVLLLGILAGIFYLRKRERERAELRSKYSDGSDGGEDYLSSSSDDDYELDFSGKSAGGGAGGGGVATVAALFGPSGVVGARASVLALGRASALFSRTPHSVAVKHASVTGTIVEPTHGSYATVAGVRMHQPGEELRQLGVPRFSDKYGEMPALQCARPSVIGHASVVTAPASTVSYTAAAAGAGGATSPSFSVPFSGSSVGTLGPHPSDDPYRLQRTSTKTTMASPTPRKPTHLDVASATPSTASRPAPAVPLTPGRRSSVLLLAELGYGTPTPTARRVANPADLCDPDLIPENSCSFINPLAVMCADGGAAAGAPAGGGFVRRPGMSPPKARVPPTIPSSTASALRTRLSEAFPSTPATLMSPPGNWDAVRQSGSSSLSLSRFPGSKSVSPGTSLSRHDEAARFTVEEDVEGEEAQGGDELMVSDRRRPVVQPQQPLTPLPPVQQQQQRQRSLGSTMTTEPSFRLYSVASGGGPGFQGSEHGGGAGGSLAGSGRPSLSGVSEAVADPIFGMVLAPVDEAAEVARR